MSNFEEIAVLLFLSAVSIWIFVGPAQARDRIFLFIGALLWIAIVGPVLWIFSPWNQSGKRLLAYLLIHLATGALASILVAISIRLLKAPSKRPDEPIR